MAIEKGMSAYEAARERKVEENKRKMEVLNLRHLSAAISEAPKTPSSLVLNLRHLSAAISEAPKTPSSLGAAGGEPEGR